MSVDWHFCIVHEQAPNSSADDMLKTLGYLESAGYLQNVGFDCNRGDEREVELDSLDAVSDWLRQTPGPWDTVTCTCSISVMGQAEEFAATYPAYSQLVDELMDASKVASANDVFSPVYCMSVSPGGVSIHMEGYIDIEPFLAELANGDATTALVEGLSSAVGRPMQIAVLEDIGSMRIIPDDESIETIAADIAKGLAGASDAFKNLVEPELIEPTRRTLNEDGKYPYYDYWVVTNEFEHNGKLFLVAYDPSLTCWYMARPASGETTEYHGYHPFTFAAFVKMIQSELDALSRR